MAFLHRDIGTYLPEITLHNNEISEKFPEWSSKGIFEKIGIKSRHLAIEEDALDMAEMACHDFFNRSSIDKNVIDYLILVTSSPRFKLPTSACILQDKLGLSNSVGAIDVNLGCSGYVYGLELAKALIDSGIKKNVLLVTSETYTKFIDQDDKGNISLFGDGATCSLVSYDDNQRHSWKIGLTRSGTDGSGYDKLIVRDNEKLYMDGKAVFEFTANTVVQELKFYTESLKFPREIGFIFHQANAFMLNYMRRKLNISPERFLVDFENKGNTVSSTIPFVINSKGDTQKSLILVGFGVGLSWAFCELQSLNQ